MKHLSALAFAISIVAIVLAVLSFFNLKGASSLTSEEKTAIIERTEAEIVTEVWSRAKTMYSDFNLRVERDPQMVSELVDVLVSPMRPAASPSSPK